MRFIFLLCLITLCFSQSTIDCGNVTNTVTCTFDSTTSTLTISGAGELSKDMPWRTWSGCNRPKKIIITAPITEIPDGAFTPKSGFPPAYDYTEEVQLPSTLKKIGKNAFYNSYNLVNVTIDPSAVVEIIDETAFSTCKKLVKCDLKGAKTIGAKAFYNTEKLEGFDLSKAQTIGNEAFYKAQKLVVSDLSQVQVIGSNAFYQATSIETINLASIQTIGEKAFENCNLKNINFGKNLTSIGTDAFSGCSQIQSFSVDGENKVYSSHESVLYEIKDSKKQLIFYPPAKNSTQYTIAENTKIVISKSFQNVPHLERIDFGSSVETINAEAFYNCANLQYVVIGRSVNDMKLNAFTNCKIKSYEVDKCNKMFKAEDGILYTKSVNNKAMVKYPQFKEITKVYSIPSGVKVIYDNAFADITNLEELTIGNDVYSIHSYAFKGCTNLKKVTITASITSVGTSVFAELKNLEEVFIGKNVKMIGNNMFNDCTKLSKVTFEEGSQLLSIEQYSFRNTAIGSIIIPDNVIYLMDNAFAEIKTLENVTIGKNVISIGIQCFTNCPKLKTFIINSEKLLTIDNLAFDNCPLIESIQIPASIEIISNKAFWRCTALKTITYKGTDQPAFCSELAFDGLTNITVNVESTYSKQQFCGMYVTKANPPPVIPPGNNSTNSTNPPGTNSTNPPNGKPTNPDNGISLTTILMLLTFIFFMI